MRRSLTLGAGMLLLVLLAAAGHAEGVCWDERPSDEIHARGCVADRRITSPPPTVESDERVVAHSSITAQTPAGFVGSHLVVNQLENTFPAHTFRYTGAGIDTWYYGEAIREAALGAGVRQSQSTANDMKNTRIYFNGYADPGSDHVRLSVAVVQDRGFGNPCRQWAYANASAAGQHVDEMHDFGECLVEAPDLPDIPLP